MRRIFLLPTACFLLLSLFFVHPLLAQWETDVRMTFNDSASYLSRANGRCVAASGDTVYVVWEDFRDNIRPGWNSEIYYKRSTDKGTTWGPDTRLTYDPAGSQQPSVVVSGPGVHVIWIDSRDSTFWGIYYKRSTDGGTTWTPDARLTDSLALSYDPSIAVSGSFVFLSWEDFRSRQGEIFYKCSSDGGTTWSPDTRLASASAHESPPYPVVAVLGSEVHVVWWDDRDINNEIYYKRSTDRGITWGPDTRLTNDTYDSWYPSISVSGSNVFIAWADAYGSNRWEIHYKRSSDGGVTWGPDTRLTSPPSVPELPSVAISSSAVHLFWNDYLNGNGEIYYKLSLDGGATWGPDTRLTNAPGTSYLPSVAVSGSTVHVAWQDDRDENWEIYYKRNLTGQPGFMTIPKIRLNVAPNPFLSYGTVLGHEGDLFALFDITGRQVGTYMGNHIGADMPSGVYFLQDLSTASYPARIVKLR